MCWNWTGCCWNYRTFKVELYQIFKFFCFSFLLASSTFGVAQTVVLEQKGKQLNPDKKNGPNLRRYSNLSFGYLFLYQKRSADAYQINFPRSIQVNVSRRGKRKLNSLVAVGNEFGFTFKNINIKNNPIVALGPEINRINRLSINGSLYSRINFDKKRGNRLGYFLDIGAGVDYFFFNKAISNIDLPSISYDGIKVSYNRIKELKPIEYFSFARLGAEKINIIFQLLLNEQVKDLSKSILITKKLPTFKAGIEINLKK